MGLAVRVVVADGHPMRRAGYVALLEASPGINVVGEASTGAEAVHLTLATHPDVVLVDALVPVLDGVATTRQIVAAHRPLSWPHPRLVLLADSGVEEYVYEACREGARGFVPSDASPTELADAIHVAAAGGALPNAGATVRLIARFTPTPGEREELAERRSALSTGDAIVVVGVGSGHDDATIATNLGIETSEVERRVTHLLRALGIDDRTQLVVFAYQSGLLSRASIA